MSCNLKDFSLENTMSRAEYTRYIQNISHQTSKHIIRLMDSLQQMNISTKILKGMYGLKETAIIPYNQLISQIYPHGYHTVPFRSGTWSRRTIKTKNSPCVDDFGVKYLPKMMRIVYVYRDLDR